MLNKVAFQTHFLSVFLYKAWLLMQIVLFFSRTNQRAGHMQNNAEKENLGR